MGDSGEGIDGNIYCYYEVVVCGVGIVFVQLVFVGKVDCMDDEVDVVLVLMDGVEQFVDGGFV